MTAASFFFEQIQRHGWVAHVIATWRGALPPETLAALREGGWFESHPILDDDWYPCPSPGGDGCPRRVVTFGEQLTAICGCVPNDCEDIEIPDEDAEMLEVSPASARSAAARALVLDSVDDAPPRRRDALRLGERRFGNAVAAFWFVPRLDERHRDWLELLPLREANRTPAVVVPRREAVAPAAADLARALGLSLVPLESTLDLENHRVDLADFVLAHKFEGIDPGELLGLRHRLVLDPMAGRYWLEGDAITPLSRWPIVAAFLVELARRPGHVVPRSELCAALWPDEYGARGWQEIDWDRRVRDQRSRLSKVCGEKLPISAQSGSGGDIDGGYMLDLPPSQVGWWSQPAT